MRISDWSSDVCSSDLDDLIRIQEELIDRFGKLPEAAQVLLTTHRLRLAAQPLGIVKIDASEAQALLQFGPKAAVDPLRIIELVQKQRHLNLAGKDKLRIELKAPQVPARAHAVRAVHIGRASSRDSECQYRSN